MNLISSISEYHAEMERWRHDIHKHPDTESAHRRTMGKIAELLRSFKCDEVVEDFTLSSVIGVLRHGDGPLLCLSAGTEGQPLQENHETLEYRSIVPGFMHAVGHDGEVAMLLGAAKYLTQTRAFKGTIVFLFYGHYGHCFGMTELIESGFLQKYPINKAFKLRSTSRLKVGEVAVAEGPVTATVAELLIQVIGEAGHSAVPHFARNPILAAANIIQSLENLVASEVDPASPLMISVNSCIAGDSYFFIPKIAELKGSVRFLNPEISTWLPSKIERLVNKLAESYGVEAVMSYKLYSEACINESVSAHFARDVARAMLGHDAVKEIQPKKMLGHDFGYLLKKVPGALISIGNGFGAGTVSSQYNFNDNALPIGASLLVNLAKSYLKA